MSSNYTLEIKELPGSELELKGELPANDFEQYRKQALARLKKNASLPGFRKGNVPDGILSEQIGEPAILEEMAVLAIETIYRDAIQNKSIDAIGRPELSITKLATGNPLGFTIKTAVAPKVTLPDFKTIAKGVMAEADETTEPTEAEIDKVVTDLRARQKHTDHPPHEGHEDHAEAETDEAPLSDDDFAKSLGSFPDMTALKAKIKENLVLEKEARNRQKKRVAILDKLVEATPITLPRLLVERESEQMLAEMQYNIENMGLNFAEYLEKIKKSAAELRTENEPSAERRIKAKLILTTIGKAEKVEVPVEEIAREVTRITEYYKDVNPERAMLYAEDVLREEKVFQLLESQK